MIRAILLAGILACPTGGQAEEFQPVTEKFTFLQLVEGRELRRLGIRLNVLGDGRIEGKALGRPVTGNWQWQDGYFCRDMRWGDREITHNCQTVRKRGNALRFTSDRGQGDFADLSLN